MSDYRTLRSAVEELIQIIRTRVICGADWEHQRLDVDEITRRIEQDFTRTVFHGKWERGWAAHCDVDARVIKGEYRNQPVLLLECEIGWSGSNRGVVGALAANSLYREVIELSAHLEHQWSRFPVTVPEEILNSKR